MWISTANSTRNQCDKFFIMGNAIVTQGGQRLPAHTPNNVICIHLYTEENWFLKRKQSSRVHDTACELFPFHPLNLKIALLFNEERARFADDLLSYYNFCCGFSKKTLHHSLSPPKKNTTPKTPVIKKMFKTKKRKKKKKRRAVACLRFKRNHKKLGYSKLKT